MRTAILATILGLLSCGAAQANCIYPRAPDKIPDGNTATEAEMVAAQAAVRQFNEDVNAYNTCLELELESLAASGQFDDQRLAQLQLMQIKKNNAAVDEVQAVADRFNEQLRVYLARTKKK